MTKRLISGRWFFWLGRAVAAGAFLFFQKSGVCLIKWPETNNKKTDFESTTFLTWSRSGRRCFFFQKKWCRFNKILGNYKKTDVWSKTFFDLAAQWPQALFFSQKSDTFLRKCLENIKIPEMAYMLKNGYNNNEVILVPKDKENKGFFEKFFQLFS